VSAASLGLLLLAPDLVRVVYGARYAPMIGCFQILILYGFFRALTAVAGPLFIGTGRPHLELSLQVVRVSTLAVAIYPATKAWGISGAALSTVFSMGISMVWAFSRVYGILGGPVLLCWARESVRVSAALAAMAGVVWAARYFGVSASVFGLIGTVFVGAVVYGAALFVIWPKLLVEGRSLVRKSIS